MMSPENKNSSIDLKAREASGSFKSESEKKVAELVKEVEANKDLKFLNGFKQEFPDAGIFLVGGVVRDKILDKKSKDFDFIISGVKAGALQEFLHSLPGKIKLVGRDYGIFKYYPPKSELGEPVDIALPRREDYSASKGVGGYHDVEAQTSFDIPIEKDMERRDFTINSMSIDMRTGKLIDPFGGLRDLEDKIIRAVGGDPLRRLDFEDRSRALRAIRFAVKYNFEIEEETWDAMELVMQKMMNKRYDDERERWIHIVPSEKIGSELLKAFDADPVKTLELLDKSGALQTFLPEVYVLHDVEQSPEHHAEGDTFVHTLLALKSLPKDASIEAKLATILHDVGKYDAFKKIKEGGKEKILTIGHDQIGEKIVEDICKRLRLPIAFTEKVKLLVKQHMLLKGDDWQRISDSKVAKYFLEDEEAGKNLLDVSEADLKASVSADQDQNLKDFEKFKKRLEILRGKLAKEKSVKWIKELVTGEDIKSEFGLMESPEVGQLLKKGWDFIINHTSKTSKRPTKKEVLEFLGESLNR